MVWMWIANETNPTEWGWKQENDQLIPIMTQNNAEPDELLKIINCNSSRGCKSSRCSCRCYGLPCTAAFWPCQTENCDNPNNTQEVDNEEEDDTKNWMLWNFLYGQSCLWFGESIVMELPSFACVGGHYWCHIGFLCYICRPTSFFMIVMCSMHPNT